MKNIIKLICFAFVVVLCAGCGSVGNGGTAEGGPSNNSRVTTLETKLSLHKKRVFVDTQPFKLKGGMPDNGVYSGDGVEDGNFYPMRAGVGEHVITYMVNQKSTSDTIEVVALTKLSLHKKRVFVAVPPFALKGGTPKGGVYSGIGVKNGKFYPEKAGTGKHTITYTVNDRSASDTIDIFGPRSNRVNPNCFSCKGTGKQYCDTKIICENCDGKGKLLVRNCTKCDTTGKVGWLWKTDCDECAGAGKIYQGCTECKESGQVKCPLCKGTGKRKCQQCN